MKSYFRFKQFTIHQEACAMKVGTDGVLLGAWCNAEGKLALDIGTGTGIIAIMLAQRNPQVQVIGIEIDKSASDQAKRNMEQSPWGARLKCLQDDFNSFSTQCDARFDLIVSNPPFFVDSLKGPLQDRNLARHADGLSYSDLLSGVQRLLTLTGIFALILPYVEGNLFIAMASEYGLCCTRKTCVFAKKGRNVKRLLLEFQNQHQKPFRENQLCIENEQVGSYTTEYQELTKDFYLNF